ncbi:MAG TPA: hypothetical protein VKT83_18785 [bacterium]|nr:hypothetical protein [bacterium]
MLQDRHAMTANAVLEGHAVPPPLSDTRQVSVGGFGGWGVHEDGRPYYGGPYHPSVFKSHRRPINEHLSEWGMERVEEIGFVVAHHSGGFVNGIVVRLLRGEEDVEALVARVIEARAHLAKTDGPLSVIVSGWRRRRPPEPTASVSPPADDYEGR